MRRPLSLIVVSAIVLFGASVSGARDFDGDVDMEALLALTGGDHGYQGSWLSSVREGLFHPPAAQVVPTVYGESETPRHALDVGLARPTALASGDFDEDGVADLIGGYEGPDGGIVALHRGNVDSIFPYSPEARQRRLQGTFSEEPFLPSVQAFPAPVRPDFLAAGDFDNDGHWDVVVAASGEASLYLLPGDGDGGLEAAEHLELAGAVTTLAAGEINRADGLVDLVVGVHGPGGPALLVFEGPEGALRCSAEVLPVSAAPTALLLARLGGGPWRDLAVAVGDELVIFRGRDRRLVLGEAERAEVGPPVTERIVMPSKIEAVSWGDFAWEPTARRELALLLEDGTIRLMGRTRAEDRPVDATPELSWETIGQREVLGPRAHGTESSTARRLLLPVRISGSPTEDLAIFDATDDRLKVLAGMVRDDPAAQDASLADPGVVSSLDLDESPVAALPMRLNRDALTDLVLLQTGTVAPLVVTTVAQATITVDTAADNAFGGDGQCTLREAINNANSDSDTTGGDCAAGSGVDSVVFNIGGGGSTATIKPHSVLPTITDPVTIDGTTQGCVSPPCVALDGGGTGSVVAGVQIAAGSSSLRGLVVQRFRGDPDDPDVNGYGIFITSSGNIIEGNYSGTDVTGTVDAGNADAGLRIEEGSNNTVGGTAASAGNLLSGSDGGGLVISGTASVNNLVLGNLIGTDRTGTVGLGNTLDGVLIGSSSSDNTIGGTTAGSRNVVSANGDDGVWITKSGTFNRLQGNYIGTDVTGTVGLGNGTIDEFGDGVLVVGLSNTIGGTATGARNIISANGYLGVRIIAADNAVLGNYIGTDVTGTVDLGNTANGVGVTEPDNTIGGTTSGARNIISGNDYSGVALWSEATGVSVLGNYIGTDVTGTVALGNTYAGVAIVDAHGNTVGGTTEGARNVISGGHGDGVYITGVTARYNEVLGNFIGTDVTGTVVLRNATNGVSVESPDNIVGGTTSAARNIISGNVWSGVALYTNATGVSVLGNFIGTDVTGTVDLGNVTNGVSVESPNNTIGGTASGARNIISGNGLNGVSLFANATGGSVLGNYIGTDVTGTVDLGNAGNGVAVGSSNNTIGGTASGARNIISGNDFSGVALYDDATGVSVLGNYIGTQIDGTSPLGNSMDGVTTLDSATNNTIGGTAVTPGRCDGPCNRIGFNGWDGVGAQPGSTRGNGILGNRISGCVEMGIDLADPGVTLNDPGDGDTGANDMQNFPELSLAEATPTGATVEGLLDSTPSGTFRVEFFANLACDATGHGEGSRYLGFADVSTDGTGIANFSVGLSGPVSNGEVITATATNSSNSTSEFSGCFTAVCLSTAVFGQTVAAQDKSTLSWATPDDVRFMKGDLTDVGSYVITATGELPGATSLDVSADNPGPGTGLYYLIRSLACGSWQNTPGAEPGRDALP